MSIAQPSQNIQDIATQVDEDNYYIVKDGVSYDLRIQADCDQVQALLDAELIALKARWEVIKEEADNLLKSVEAGIF